MSKPVRELRGYPEACLKNSETRVGELKDALRPFAKLADEINGKDTDYVACSMLCADFNRARIALNAD